MCSESEELGRYTFRFLAFESRAKGEFEQAPAFPCHVLNVIRPMLHYYLTYV